MPGRQPELLGAAELWVVPNPSGLNAHETVDSLAAAYAGPAAGSAGPLPGSALTTTEFAGRGVAVGDAVGESRGVGQHGPELLVGQDCCAEGDVAPVSASPVGRADVEVRGHRSVGPVQPLQQYVEWARASGDPEPRELRSPPEHLAPARQSSPLSARASESKRADGMSRHTW